MFKFPRFKLAALGALTFGLALSFGAFAWENNGPCVSCHMACDDARLACVASGGSYCMQQFKTCERSCSRTIPGCQIP